MKSSLLKRGLIAGTAIIASVGTFGALIPQAGAISPTQITIAGSDTTQNVMRAIAAATTTPGVNYTNVDSYPAADVVIPADDHCAGAVTWRNSLIWGSSTASATLQKAPNGSSAGRASLGVYALGTLYGATNRACLDIARSSSYGADSPVDGAEYYGFALDAVNWATTSQNAPSSLTPTQLAQIYQCTFTDWSQVGGTAGPIQRYLPPSGSGTRDYFLEEVLKSGDSTITKSTTFPTNASCPAVLDLEEHTANTISLANWNKAVFAYSGGVWSYQAANATNPTIDKRGRTGAGTKARMGGFNRSTFALTGTGDNKINNANVVAWNTGDGAWQLNTPGLAFVTGNASDPGGFVVKEQNSKGVSGYVAPLTADNVFPGIRIVYNVVDSRIGTVSADLARAFVGFDNSAGGTKSPLCNGELEGIILSNGFATLPSSGGGDANVAGSTCRKVLA
ncbi:PstS ABC-type phosphate transport system, periplasmic component [Acidimicrobiia bacterium]